MDLWWEESGSGPDLVLLHPGIHDSTVWDPVLPLLDGYRVIRFDQRGFGHSPVARTAFSTWRDLLAVLDDSGVPRAHLAGNSMGGAAALSLALERPDRVASLTLLAPGVSGYPWAPPTSPERIAFEEEFEASARAFKEARDAIGMGLLLGSLFCRAGIDDSVREQLVASSTTDFAQEGLEEENPDHWGRLSALDVPVTVVVGDLDDVDEITAGTALAGRIPHASLVHITRADHLLPLRAPHEVASAIRRTTAAAVGR